MIGYAARMRRPVLPPLLAMALLASLPALAVPGQAPRDPRPSIAVMQIAVDEHTTASVAKTIEQQVAFALGESGRFSRVVAPDDLRDLLGFEKNREMLGCAEGAACIAEIAGALGVDYLASTRIGYLGQTMIVNLNLLDARTSAATGRARRQLASADGLAAALDEAVREVLKALPAPAIPAAASSPTEPARPTSRLAMWAAAGAAVVALAAGIGLGLRTKTVAADASRTDAVAARASAESASNAALGANISFGVAGAAAAAGVVLWRWEK